MPSLARNSLARFTADVTGLVLGTVVGIITARWLGPAGKGLLSAAAFLAGFCIQLAVLGMGEAAIVAIGQKRNSVQQVLESSLAVIIPAALAGIAVLWGVSRLEFHDTWQAARVPVLVAAFTIPVNLLNQVAVNIINSEERFVFSSSLLTLSSALILLSTWVFVVTLKGGVSGALAASIVGVGASALIAVGWLATRGLRLLPRVNWSYLRFALPFGSKVQLSNLLVTAAARFDLLIVYTLAGQSAAGEYSIALTIGMLTTMLPFALVNASFPRIAGVSETDASGLSLRLNRMTLMTSGAVAIAAAVISPWAIPFAFGPAYHPAIVPAIILLAGGVAASSQYMLARARAARGEPNLLLYSYGLNTVVMIGLDFLLIPKAGVTGAAIASTIGSFAGAAVSIASTIRAVGRPVTIAEMLPGVEELRELAFVPDVVFPSRKPVGAAARVRE